MNQTKRIPFGGIRPSLSKLRDAAWVAFLAVVVLVYLISNDFDTIGGAFFVSIGTYICIILNLAFHAWPRALTRKDRSLVLIVCVVLCIAALALALQLAYDVACSLDPDLTIISVACDGLSKPVLLVFLLGSYGTTALSIVVLAIVLTIRRRYSLVADVMAIHLVKLWGSSAHGLNVAALVAVMLAGLDVMYVWQGLDDILLLTAFSFLLIAVGLIVCNTRLPRIAFDGRRHQRRLRHSSAKT